MQKHCLAIGTSILSLFAAVTVAADLGSTDFSRLIPVLDSAFCCQEQSHPLISQFAAEQNTRFRAQVDGLPIQAELKARFGQIVPTNAIPRVEVSGRSFFTKGGSLLLQGAPGQPDQVLVPANPETFTVVVDFKVSPDGTKVAVGQASRGQDHSLWSVLDVATRQVISGQPIRIRLENVSWNQSSSGIFYTAWPQSDEEEHRLIRLHARTFQVRFRPVPGSAAQESVIFTPPATARDMIFGVDELVPGQRFIAYRTQGPAEIPIFAYILDKQPDGQMRMEQILDQTLSVGRYIGHKGQEAFFRTSQFGSDFGVIGYNAETRALRQVIPVVPGQNLNIAYFNGEKFVLIYLNRRMQTHVEIAALNNLGTRELIWNNSADFNGGVGFFKDGIVGAPNSTTVYAIASSIGVPHITYRFDLSARATITKVPGTATVDFDQNKVIQELVTYRSADGQPVPMQVFVPRKAGFAPKFAYLFYYGSIGTAQPAWWNRKLQMALEMGAVVGIALIRGGGEFGRDWTALGEQERLRTISDIAFASRYLRQRFNLTADQVVSSSRSNGGAHALSAMTLFPQDFGLVMATVPESSPERWLERGEFGQLAADDFGFERNPRTGALENPKLGFAKLAQWSPLANADRLKAPVTTVMFTGDNDERVSPLQSYFLAAKLLAKFGPSAPVFVVTDKNAGHFARSEFLDEMTFIAKKYGIEHLEPLNLAPAQQQR